MFGFHIAGPRVREELALLQELGRSRRLASLKKSLQRARPAEEELLHEFQGDKDLLTQREGAAFVSGK